MGCASKDFACYCEKAASYQQAAGKCLLAASCRSQAMASKTASDAVCACVKGGAVKKV